MKKNALLFVALCALLPAVSSADPDCNCEGGEVDSDDASKNILGTLTVYGKPCDETCFGAYPYDECVGFEEAKERKDCITNVIVRNEPYADPIEEVPVSFDFLCDHKKKIHSDGIVRIFYDDGRGKGEDDNETASIHWRVSLGQALSGRGAGRLRIDSDEFSPRLWSPSALFLDAPAVRDVVMKAPPHQTTMRQILSDESFVEILDESTNGYSLAFYDPSVIVGTRYEYFYRFHGSPAWVPLSRPITNDLDRIAESIISHVYEVADGAVPFVRYDIERRSDSSFRITRTWRNAEPFYREFSCLNSVWTCLENGVRSTSVSNFVHGSETVKTWTTEDSSGQTTFERRVFATIGGRELPTEITVGTGPSAITTRQFFFTNASEQASFGKLRRAEGPDGNWSENGYDSVGRLSSVRSGWLSGGTNDLCRHVVYSYAPVFSGTNAPAGLPVDDGAAERTTPRVETVYVGDVPVEKTLRAIHRDALGYIRVETVRLLDPTVTDRFAAWSDPDNPHSLAIYMPENYGKPCSKLPWLVVNPDGTATSYDYISGNYVPGADGTPGTFTQVQGGPHFRTIATHGTAESFGIDSMGCSTNYAGIPLRTTRDVKIELRTGKREVLRETQVCNAAGGYETVSWTTKTLDDLGHVVATRSSDGSRTSQEWLGDRLVASTGADGIRTVYAYDGLGRRVSSTYADPLTGAEVVSSTTYDAAGRALASTTTAGGLSQSTQRRYDGAGRLVWSRGPDGIETTTSYGTTNGLHFVATTRGADGLFTTSATYSYADGRTAYVERNGNRAETYDYGCADGLQWTIAYEGPKGTNSPVWTASVSDALGRTVRELRPGFGGAILATENEYNAAGQLLSSEEYTLSAETTPRTPRTPREILTQSMASQGSLRSLRSLREIENQSMTPQGSLRARTLYAYDSLGALRVSAQDVDLSGTIDFAGPDIVSSNETAFAFLDSAWWQESSRYSFPDTGSSASLRVSTTRTRLSGLGVSETTELGTALLASETRAIDALGNVSSQKSYRNRTAHTTFNFSASAASALSAWSFSLGGHSVSNRTATGILSSRVYDALGRVIAQTDGRGLVSSYSYDEQGRLASTTDATGATTAYGYDSLGRQISVTNALGLVTMTAYDLDGNVVSQRGAQYPVDYAYDAYGRMAAMSTYRSEDLSHADVTTWLYDEATGLMTNKVYADGKGPTYDYTPEGRLARRTWARGITTDYAYDSQGRLVSKNYSDSTPDVSLAYDRLGHTLSAICSGVSTNLYVYNRLGQLTNEVQNGTPIARAYDALGRATGYAIGDGVAAGSAVSYSYDTLGRFASVSSGTNVFSYAYLPGSDLVSGMAANTGHAWERIYESDRNLIATVHNHYGNRTISRFDYTNDEIGRRIARVDSGEAFSETAFERYAYNDRSEVIGSQRFYGSDIDDLSRPVTGRTFGYGYDPIGNRVSSFEDVGGERLTTTYTANELNQYTAIQNASAVPLRGDAKREAVVTVNDDRAERDNGTASFTPWSYSLPSDDATAHYQNADILAVAQNAAGEDVEQRKSGLVFVPAEETFLTYDDDGNMTFDGRFRYSWNGENRMIRAEEVVAPTNRAPTVIAYAYDEQGRMVSKNIASTNTIARLLLWDGYNIVRETDNGVPTYNIWGLDLDGTLQGCGGVGGLLAVVRANGVFFSLYDANGNVSDYISNSGIFAAHFEYSSSGETLVAHGTEFPIRFSTKRYCPWTGVIEYLFRSYNSKTSRWMQRDQGNEESSHNLQSFLNNNALARVDFLGLEQIELRYETDSELSWIVRQMLPGGTIQVSDKDALINDLKNRFKGKPISECDCVKALYIAGHGNEGNIYLFAGNNQLRITAEYLKTVEMFANFAPNIPAYAKRNYRKEFLASAFLDEIASYLCPKAYVEFITCHSGKGEDGAELKRLLQKRLQTTEVHLYDNYVLAYVFGFTIELLW